MPREIIKGRLIGVDQAMTRLAAINAAVRNKILRTAVGRAGRPLVRAVRDALPEASGWLKKSQAAKTKTFRNSGVTVLIVGPRTNYKSPQGEVPTNIMHLAEGGRKAVRAQGRALPLVSGITGGVFALRKAAAAQPAKPVMANAIERTQSQVTTILESEIAKGIEKFT